MSKWFTAFRLWNGRTVECYPDAFDAAHGLWRVNASPPSWL